MFFDAKSFGKKIFKKLVIKSEKSNKNDISKISLYRHV